MKDLAFSHRFREAYYQASMKTVFLAIVLLSTPLIANVHAQQPTPTPSPAPQKPVAQSDADDVVRITTNLVQVDAVIIDSKGKMVTDLKPEEVEIFENGRKQKISNFSYNVTVADVSRERPAKPAVIDKNAPPIPPTRLRPEDVRRTIALVVDDLGLSFESMHYVRRTLKKFVDEEMQEGDLVAIIRTGSGMGALQQFTADKRQLYAAIERVRYNLSRANVGVFAPLQPPTAGEMGPAIDKANEDLDKFREDLFAVGSLGALSYVIKGLRDLPGRKAVLFMSDGFISLAADDADRNYRTTERMRRLVDMAGRASVVIYTLNASGLQTTGLNAADSTGDTPSSGQPQLIGVLDSRSRILSDRQASLSYLAYETGGFAITNENYPWVGMRRVLEDQKGYYLIGYRPDESTFSPRTGQRQFHRLTLKVTRPGNYTVRMRNGFFGVSDEEARPKLRTLAQQMTDALTSPFGATGVRLQLTALFASDANEGSYMRAMLHINAADLTFVDTPNSTRQAVFDIVAMTFGDNGVLVDRPLGRTYTIQLSDELYKRALRDGLVYNLTVPIKKPGAYQLRMSFRDSSSERIGSASQFIDAPDIKKKRLALSGLVVRGENRTGKSTLTSTTIKPEGLEEGNAEASAAVRRFARGMVMTYGYFIYNARVEKASNPQLLTQVRLFRDGKEVFTGKETPFDTNQQTDLTRLSVAGAIQLGSEMAPGDYVLQVVVKDLLADQKHRIATQWMDFQIVK